MRFAPQQLGRLLAQHRRRVYRRHRQDRRCSQWQNINPRRHRRTCSRCGAVINQIARQTRRITCPVYAGTPQTPAIGGYLRPNHWAIASIFVNHLQQIAESQYRRHWTPVHHQTYCARQHTHRHPPATENQQITAEARFPDWGRVGRSSRTMRELVTRACRDRRAGRPVYVGYCPALARQQRLDGCWAGQPVDEIAVAETGR